MRSRPLPVLLALALSGCAAAQPGYDPKLGKVAEVKVAERGEVGADGRYQMTAGEQALDCKKLTGSMQITITRIKDRAERPAPSSTSSSIRSSLGPMFGGSNYDLDPQKELAREKAKLHAYNQALAQKGCKTLDVDALLAAPASGPVRY